MLKQYETNLKGYELIEYQNRENKKEPCMLEWCCYGSLLDNVLIYGKRCLLFFVEHYLNPNASDYIMYTAPYTDEKACNKIWEMFYKLKNEYEQEYGIED